MNSPSRSFVAISKFEVANGMTEAVKTAFLERPHLVDSEPGFCGMDVLSPIDNPDELWLMTYWTDEASFRTWHHGHTYHESHRGIPRGLKLVPKETWLRLFTHVAS